MLIGTMLGIVLGLGQISKNRIIRRFSWFITQLFRNSPWLVLLFIVLLAFPFEVTIFGVIIPIPDWMKAVIGLSLPIMANISEIVRGAVLSVPTAQWEAAESLAFSRQQILWRIILPPMFQAYDSALDELVCHSDHGNTVMFTSRGRRNHHAFTSGDGSRKQSPRTAGAFL